MGGPWFGEIGHTGAATGGARRVVTLPEPTFDVSRASLVFLERFHTPELWGTDRVSVSKARAL